MSKGPPAAAATAASIDMDNAYPSFADPQQIVPPPAKVQVLLVTRDRDLLVRLADSPRSGALTIDYVDDPSCVSLRLKEQCAPRVLVVDLSAVTKQELGILLLLILAFPDVPVLMLDDEDDPVLGAGLLSQGVQDVMLKRNLSGDGLWRAARNATARKTRDAAVFDDNERARATLASIGDGVLSTDRAWIINFMNPTAEELTGWTCDQAIGQPIASVFQVLHGVTREPLMPQIESAVGSGSTIILPRDCVLLRRSGEELPIDDSAAPIYHVDGELSGMVVVFHDISGSRAVTQKMSHLAEHDVLTCLPNRALLNDRLQHGIALAERHCRRMAVLFIDLDHFKHINDSLGHLIGDRILKAVSQRIIPCIRQSDTLSRYGGDEFVVVLSEVNRAEDAAAIAEKIRLAVMEPYVIDSHYLHLTTSIGVSIYPHDGGDASTLLQYADTAMYHAKEKGRNNSQFFKNDMNVRAEERQVMTGDLRHALMRGEFFLAFQPKVNLLKGNVTGFEALIRWCHPTRGILFRQPSYQLRRSAGSLSQLASGSCVKPALRRATGSMQASSSKR